MLPPWSTALPAKREEMLLLEFAGTGMAALRPVWSLMRERVTVGVVRLVEGAARVVAARKVVRRVNVAFMVIGLMVDFGFDWLEKYFVVGRVWKRLIVLWIMF
jgi:hypothetical protein